MSNINRSTRLDPNTCLQQFTCTVPGAFEFDLHGECELLFDNKHSVMIRSEENEQLTLAICVAKNITNSENWLFARLMSYQWLGRATKGFLLSWNDLSGSIFLSHRITHKWSMTDLYDPLENLIKTAHIVQHDIHAIIESGENSVPTECSADMVASSLHIKV